MISKRAKVQHEIVELKARVDDLAETRDKLIEHGAERVGIFHQVDTYYEVPRGRLKLREVEGKNDAALIYYERENVANPKKSSVSILTIPQPQAFKQILALIMKAKAVVGKIREIYIYQGVQVHLDTVRSLGYFVEFELATSSYMERQKKDASKLDKLREQLNINAQNLERHSYSDLT
jgi:predicted adenylyl cyclase CyaB